MERANQASESLIPLTLTLLALFLLLAGVLNVLGYAFAFTRTGSHIHIQSSTTFDRTPASGLPVVTLQSI